MNTKCFQIVAAALLVPLVCGCHKEKKIEETPMRVKIIQLGAGNALSSLYYSGTVEAEKSIALGFLTAGTVSVVSAREGDSVKKGQLLAQLDCQSNKNALGIAREKANQAEDAFSRFEPMYQHGNLPEIKMVEIRTARAQSALALKMAEKNVEDCHLRAPEDSMVSARLIEPGDNAIPGKSVMKLVAMDRIYSVISVPEREIKGIKKGMAAEVELSGQEEARLTGKVADVGVAADPLSRTYTVRILVKNPERKALPGMLCNVYVSRGAVAPAQVVIPATAIKVDGENRQFVYVADPVSKRVRKVAVASSGFRESGVLVSSGLRGNELVVGEGVQKLDDNMLVEPAL